MCSSGILADTLRYVFVTSSWTLNFTNALVFSYEATLLPTGSSQQENSNESAQNMKLPIPLLCSKYWKHVFSLTLPDLEKILKTSFFFVQTKTIWTIWNDMNDIHIVFKTIWKRYERYTYRLEKTIWTIWTICTQNDMREKRYAYRVSVFTFRYAKRYTYRYPWLWQSQIPVYLDTMLDTRTVSGITLFFKNTERIACTGRSTWNYAPGRQANF